MPRDIKTLVVWAEPGVAHSHRQIGGITGFLIFLWLRSPAVTVGSLLIFLVGMVLLSSPAAWAALGFAIVVAIAEFKYWYYNERLLCIRDRDCAVGTVIAEPKPSADGDRKLNLMLAPYGQRAFVETLLDHIAANEVMLTTDANFNDPPFHTAHPPLPSVSEREGSFLKLREYMEALRSVDDEDTDDEANMFNQLLIGVMFRLMRDPVRNFYNRFHRKDPAHIPEGSPLWNAIFEDFDPDPAINWEGPNAFSHFSKFNPYNQHLQGLNRMFRYDVEHLVAYLHCEIDGYALGLLLDNLMIAFIAFMLALLALWAVLGPLAPFAAAIIALLLWILKQVLDLFTGNDGNADPPLDWDDPDVPDSEEIVRKGDVVVTYGNWIMDTEHGQYFEIHPVRAFYIIARNSYAQRAQLRDGNLVVEDFGSENFDQTQIDAARADQICAMVTDGEEGDGPGPIILRSGPTALSYGMQTQYAGNQQGVE